MYTEAISLVAMRSVHAVMNCDWSRKIMPLSNLIQALLFVEWNLQQKQNWTAKSTNLEENAWKLKSVFVIRASLWAENIGCFLSLLREFKNTLGKLAVAVNTGGHLIQILTEMSANLIKCQRRHIQLWYSWSHWAAVSYALLAAVFWNIHVNNVVWLSISK